MGKELPAMQETPVRFLCGENPLEKGQATHTSIPRACLVAQLLKNLPATHKTWVRSLAWEDSLEKGKAPHSSILAWRIPWTISSMGSQRLDTTKSLSLLLSKTLFSLPLIPERKSQGNEKG